jgi:hypothetical protein
LLEKLEKKWIGGAMSILAATQGLSRRIKSLNPVSPVSTVYNGFPARLTSIEGKRRQGLPCASMAYLGNSRMWNRSRRCEALRGYDGGLSGARQQFTRERNGVEPAGVILDALIPHFKPAQ